MKIYIFFSKRKKKEKGNESWSEELIHRTRVSITKNRSNIKAFFPACSSSLSTFHHPATSCQREIWSCVIKEFAAWRYVMSTVTSRNGARPADGPLSVSWTFHIARKRLADFIELRGFLRFHERSDIFVRGYSTWKVDPFLFLFLSSLFHEGNIEDVAA